MFGGAAVVDLETGLVWERSPDPTTRIWTDAIIHCTDREVGGRKGWHLPMLDQLASLVDMTGTSAVRLPDGHPFLNVQSASTYWSATTFADFPHNAYGVFFADGNLTNDAKASVNLAWCVRGGQVFDGNTHTTLH
jgi:hypothetical protein